MHIRDIAIGVVLGAVLAGVVALTIPSPEPFAVRAPAPTPVGRSAPVLPQQPAAAAAPPAPAPTQHPSGLWRDIHAKYVHAQNLRMFFYEAMRKPGEGAYFYATRVLETCRRVLDKTLEALPSPRREAAEELLRRCDFTPDGLDDAERELDAARHLDLAADPLLGSMFGYLAADGPEGRAQMLREAFEQGNPDVIASLVAPAIQARAPVRDEQDSTARGIPFGAALVACRLGADCGPGAVSTLELCMQLGWCADSVPAALQQGLGVHYPALDRLARQVVDDIRRRDAQRLVPAQERE
ncbi:hypothetical protein [Massilia consociata]|uniref:HEAT repeat domain-containing protein n=1 Tax=Massilia consociata TaxID=760117 RepID=A0ABV6FII9_9BURK